MHATAPTDKYTKYNLIHLIIKHSYKNNYRLDLWPEFVVLIYSGRGSRTLCTKTEHYNWKWADHMKFKPICINDKQHLGNSLWQVQYIWVFKAHSASSDDEVGIIKDNALTLKNFQECKWSSAISRCWSIFHWAKQLRQPFNNALCGLNDPWVFNDLHGCGFEQGQSVTAYAERPIT